MAPELALAPGARSLYNLGSSQARKLEGSSILPSRHSASSTSNTHGFLPRFFPSLSSRDQVDPPVSTGLQAPFLTRHMWVTRGVLIALRVPFVLIE